MAGLQELLTIGGEGGGGGVDPMKFERFRHLLIFAQQFRLLSVEGFRSIFKQTKIVSEGNSNVILSLYYL